MREAGTGRNCQWVWMPEERLTSHVTAPKDASFWLLLLLLLLLMMVVVVGDDDDEVRREWRAWR